MKTARIFSATFLLLSIAARVSAQALTADAGPRDTICPGTSVTIGGAPTANGGNPPYTYLWTPNTNISSTSIANPVVSPMQPLWYHVTVRDQAGATAIDSVFVDLDPIYHDHGGNDTSICIGTSAILGAATNDNSGGITYSWTPATGLSSTTAPRPVCTTTVTTTYSVTITSPNCNSKIDHVTVTVNPLPTITASACCPMPINEGSTIILQATGGILYQWSPGNTLSNQFSANPTAEPSTTTTYYVYGYDANGCSNYDSIKVIVTPSSELVFYNTFSPNGDGMNDFFYIGNIAKYPNCRLEVYTRTGQLVFAKTGYNNTWDGTNYGDQLPEATYYWRLDPGDGSKIIFGSVTIVR